MIRLNSAEKKGPEKMPPVVATDPRGNKIRYHDFRGRRFPPNPFHDLDVSLKNLPQIPARHNDVIIVGYPKSGNHWLWEIANMLTSGIGEVSKSSKEDYMIDIQPTDAINELPSPRVLTTHACPEFYPRDFARRKTKIIYLMRNPKDVFVSFFYHVKNIRIYGYEGDWDGFFEHIMAGGVDYGSWFEFTKKWEKFFKDNRTIPVLKVCYEDLQKDCLAETTKIGRFLGVPDDQDFNRRVVAKCSFDNMKQARELKPEAAELTRDGSNPMFRRGIIGDWREHFSASQNKQFIMEYRKQMLGLSFSFEKWMT